MGTPPLAKGFEAAIAIGGAEFHREDHRAVKRLCEKAGVPKWTPNQLRHNAGTEIRRKHGLEAARLILGHRSMATTEIYAEKELDMAIQIVKEMG